MKAPIVGINCKLVEEKGALYYQLDRHYPDAITRAGGVPLILPVVKTSIEAVEWLDRVDAVLFSGGPDIHPRRWGEEQHPKAQLMHPEKEESDFLYAAEALRRDLPVLGICLGSQLLNVAMGGTLHQHIGEDHRNTRHSVELVPSKTRDIVGQGQATVNSYHHQAVNCVGEGLRVMATSPDGVVEGIESVRHRFVVGVQWHPERIADQPEQRALFRALIERAQA